MNNDSVNAGFNSIGPKHNRQLRSHLHRCNDFVFFESVWICPIGGMNHYIGANFAGDLVIIENA